MIRVLPVFVAFCLLNVGLALGKAPPRKVDERRAAQVGIRVIQGRHLRLYTDLPPSDAVDGLGAVFDAAVPLWADYFDIPMGKVAGWQMQAFLMGDRAKFSALGLLPETNSKFVNGYCQDGELWVVEQTSDYYRRHLLLHEGTHGFMYAFLGQAAPGWYMEGMAELLGTHRWHEGRLTLRYFPASRAETPMWGRIKLIRESEPLPMGGVLSFRKGRALTTDQYAWCWALCKFLDSHPRHQVKFRESWSLVTQRDYSLKEFNRDFKRLFAAHWSDLELEWQAFVAALDYGYDTKRMTVEHSPKLRNPQGDTIELSAERGWQSTGWRLRARRRYELTARGRYQIAHDTEPWPCEPDGVTIEYHNGQALGKLLGVLRPLGSRSKIDFANPIPLGSQAVIEPDAESILYLRVNESAASLSDNKGKLRVTLKESGTSASN